MRLLPFIFEPLFTDFPSRSSFYSKLRFSLTIIFLFLLGSECHGQWINTHGPHRGNIYVASNGGIIFAGTKGGIYRSLNNGTTWELANTGFIGTMAGFTVLGTYIFAANSENFQFRSIDGGLTWTQMPISGSSPTIEASGSILYVDAVRRSLDSGTTWTTLSGLGIISTRNTILGYGSSVYIGTPNGIMVSIDSGMNWRSRNGGLPLKKNVQSMVRIGTNLFAATLESGIYQSSDSGVTWTAANTGLTDTTVHILLANGLHLYAGTNKGVFRSKDNGQNWVSISDSLSVTASIKTLTISGSYLFSGSSESGLYRSNNDGLTWDYLSTGLPKTPILTIAADDVNTFVGIGGGVYFVKRNNGNRWNYYRAFNYGIPTDSTLSLAINKFKLSNSSLLLSTNNGASWSPLSLDLPPPASIQAIGMYSNNIVAAVDSVDIWQLPLIALPTLASPLNASIFQPTNIPNIWNPTIGAVSYRLQIVTSPPIGLATFDNPIFDDSTLTGTSKSVGILLKDTRYSWRVMAKNSWGFKMYSDVWSFQTGSTTSIRNRNSSAPTKWGLKQLATANDGIHLVLLVPVNGFVQVRILDAEGRVILEVSENLKPGEYFLDKNGLNPRGLYFQIIASGKIQLAQNLDVDRKLRAHQPQH